jgi:hypothetical protein
MLILGNSGLMAISAWSRSLSAYYSSWLSTQYLPGLAIYNHQQLGEAPAPPLRIATGPGAGDFRFPSRRLSVFVHVRFVRALDRSVSVRATGIPRRAGADLRRNYKVAWTFVHVAESFRERQQVTRHAAAAPCLIARVSDGRPPRAVTSAFGPEENLPAAEFDRWRHSSPWADRPSYSCH